MVNFKQIVQDLSGICYYHPQVNSFGFGDLSQITMDNQTMVSPVYTKVYVVPGNVLLNQNVLQYNFSIIVCDRVEDDLSNQPDILSDCLEIAKDIFTILYQSYTSEYGGFSLDYEPEFGPNCVPFLERFDTVLAGVTMNITVSQPFDYNECVLPFSGLTLPPSVNIVNYKQVLSDLKEIAHSHEQINSYGFGGESQLNMDNETKQTPLFSRMYTVPQNIQLSRNELIYNFDIIISDVLDDDLSNQKDVMSDMLEIVKDVFTILYLSEYESVWGAVVQPFFDEYDHVLCGWRMSLQITQPFDYNRCVLPELPFVVTNKKWYELAELWNTISTNWKNT